MSKEVEESIITRKIIDYSPGIKKTKDSLIVKHPRSSMVLEVNTGKISIALITSIEEEGSMGMNLIISGIIIEAPVCDNFLINSRFSGIIYFSAEENKKGELGFLLIEPKRREN